VDDLPKPNTRIRRYLIEVKDPLGKSLFLTAAYWDEQDKRVAIAQIMRLADIPEVNSWSEPPLEPEFGKTTRSLNRGQGRRDRCQ
jgi:hypothetical protein